jgi:hypothetical protein
LLLGSGLASAAGWPGGALDLEPGIATVDRREQQRIWLRIDPGAKTYPAQLEGQTLAIRRQTRKVSLPQSWRTLAEHWEQNAAVEVLSTRESGGALVARILWENERMPVKAGDRAERARLPAEARLPVILDVTVHNPGAPPAEGAASPGQLVWFEANIVSPTRRVVLCEWTADKGRFVHAGGADAGTTLKGPASVRWVAPADSSGKPLQATITLKAASPDTSEAAQHEFTVTVRPARGAYERTQWLPLAAGAGGGSVLSEATLVAGGPLDSVYIADAPGGKVHRWGHGSRGFFAAPGGPPRALGVSGAVAYLVDSGAVWKKPSGPDAPSQIGGLALTRPVGITFSATGDPCVFDSGAPPRLHIVEGEAPRSASIGPAVDASWLVGYCLTPCGNDVCLLNNRDQTVEVWRTLDGSTYRAHGLPVPLSPYLQTHGKAVALLPRCEANRARELPFRVVFASGAITTSWAPEGETWKASVEKAPSLLRAQRFAATTGAALPSCDVLLAGTATVEDQSVPRVAQLSPAGELRRMLPLPTGVPVSVTAGPSGMRYLLVADSASRSAKSRVVAAGPEGWMADDLGSIDRCQPLRHVRADRRSTQHILLIGESRGRARAFRFDLEDPTKLLALGPGGILGQKIPNHEAIDVASSAQHIAVLDEDGLVLVFANDSRIRLLTTFDSDLSDAAGIAVLSNITPRTASSAQGRTYVCVLPSGRKATSVHVWEITTAGGKATAKDIGRFPDPERFPADVLLSSPVAMDSGHADDPGSLYVLDRSGAQLRVFALADIAARLASRGVPDIPKAPALSGLTARKDGLDLAAGPGGAVHVADRDGAAVHSYERQP